MKDAGSLEALFLDLKTDPKPSVGNFWKDVTYAILAVDQQGPQIHLDKLVQTSFDSIWMHDHNMFAVTHVSGDLCTVELHG